ncbi:unnamed protein product, partial [marine sediment metagenome]
TPFTGRGKQDFLLKKFDAEYLMLAMGGYLLL